MSASLSAECNEVKERYDSCFLKWYSESMYNSLRSTYGLHTNCSAEFLKGTATSDECEPLFKEYRQCLTVSDAFCVVAIMTNEPRRAPYGSVALTKCLRMPWRTTGTTIHPTTPRIDELYNSRHKHQLHSIFDDKPCRSSALLYGRSSPGHPSNTLSKVAPRY